MYVLVPRRLVSKRLYRIIKGAGLEERLRIILARNERHDGRALVTPQSLTEAEHNFTVQRHWQHHPYALWNAPRGRVPASSRILDLLLEPRVQHARRGLAEKEARCGDVHKGVLRLVAARLHCRPLQLGGALSL